MSWITSNVAEKRVPFFWPLIKRKIKEPTFLYNSFLRVYFFYFLYHCLFPWLKKGYPFFSHCWCNPRHSLTTTSQDGLTNNHMPAPAVIAGLTRNLITTRTNATPLATQQCTLIFTKNFLNFLIKGTSKNKLFITT